MLCICLCVFMYMYLNVYEDSGVAPCIGGSVLWQMADIATSSKHMITIKNK